MPIWTYPQDGEEAGADIQPRLPLMLAEGLSPAVIETEGGVLRVDTRLWLVRNEGHAGVGVAAWLLAAICVSDDCFDAKLRHLERILLRCRRDLAILHC